MRTSLPARADGMRSCRRSYMGWAVLLVLVSGCDLLFGIDSVHRQGPSTDAGSRIDSADDAADADVDAGPPPQSCSDALARGITTDGVVMVDPTGSGTTVPVYCDMTTAGGGWTLVWVYGFTSYGNFSGGGNAVTPRPNWAVPANNTVTVSTTTPTDPTSPGAMSFLRWRTFGTDVLVTSNINHWIECTPGTGSLVAMTQGTVTCQVVKVIANRCTTNAPTQFYPQSLNTGPSLNNGGSGNFYYFFDGSTSNDWPTHDPCGQNQTNQLTGVTNPGGAVYVRFQGS
jgi:hypothetical protein